MFRIASRAAGKLLSLFLLLASAGALLSCGGGTAAVSPVAPAAAPPGLSLLAGNIGGPGVITGAGSDARFMSPASVVSDGKGTLFLSDSGRILSVAADGTVAIATARAGFVGWIAIDAVGNLYGVRSEGFPDQAVLKIARDGTVTKVPNSEAIFETCTYQFGTACTSARPIAADGAGSVYTVSRNAVWKVTAAGEAGVVAGSGQPGAADGQGTAASFNDPQDIALDAAGNVYVADRLNQAIRKVSPSGAVSTVATLPFQPTRLALGPNGSYFAASGCALYRVDSTGGAALLAGTPGACQWASAVASTTAFASFSSMAADPAGNVYVVDPARFQLTKVTPNGTVSAFAGAPRIRGYMDATGAAAQFRSITDIDVDSKGNLYVLDQDSATVRKVDPGGAVSTLAGRDQQPGVNDGVGTGAQFQYARYLAVGPSGNVYVPASYNKIRKITPDAVVSTMHLPLYDYSACDGPSVIDPAENLYVACGGVVLKVAPDGSVSSPWTPVNLSASQTPAGLFRHSPNAIAIDVYGNIYATEGKRAVLKLLPDGRVQELSGTEASGDRRGLAVDPQGNIYVAEIDTTAPPVFGNQPAFILKITPGTRTTLVGEATKIGTNVGTLPASIQEPRALRFIAPGVLAVATDGALLKLVLPQ